MKASFRISVIFGTRPEAIKLAPVVQAFRSCSTVTCNVCVTGQHREMLDQVLSLFGIEPDVDLNLMKPNQSLSGFAAEALSRTARYLEGAGSQLAIVQGDTTSSFCAALAAFHHRIPVAHVEAGLRTGNLLAPWPEEANRVLTSRLAALHFAPTEAARRNLLSEGVLAARVFVTGNTVVDALLATLRKVRSSPPKISGLPKPLQPVGEKLKPSEPRMVLITGHRRENFGDGLRSICESVADLAERHPTVHFVYPVHLNPNVREPVGRILGPWAHGQSRRPNIHLLEPVGYQEFVALMDRATLLLTDSGGVQEEAPSLGKPVLVMRETTERPEAVAAGTVKLVGTSKATIVGEVSRLLTDASAYRMMSRSHNPYGDGRASQRIVATCVRFLKNGSQVGMAER